MRWNVYFNCRFFILRWQKRKRLNKSKNQLNLLLIFFFFRLFLFPTFSSTEMSYWRLYQFWRVKINTDALFVFLFSPLYLHLYLSFILFAGVRWSSNKILYNKVFVWSLKTQLENTFSRIRSILYYYLYYGNWGKRAAISFLVMAYVTQKYARLS